MNHPTAPTTEELILRRIHARGDEAFAAVVQQGVTAEHFHEPFNRLAFETDAALFAANLPISQDMLQQRLVQSGKMDFGAFCRVTDEREVSLANIAALCGDLLTTHKRRHVARLALSLHEAALKSPDDIEPLTAKLLAVEAGANSAAQSWSSTCDAAIAEAKDTIAGKRVNENAVSWGWRTFDGLFSPFQRGELVVVAARPSVGKSSLLRGIIYKNALAGQSVLLETLEVTTRNVANQMATSLSGLAHKELPHLHRLDQGDFVAALERLKAARLHVFEDRTLAGIVARTRAIHASTPLAIVGVDYLGLIDDCSPSSGETKAQAVGAVTKAFKRLALDLNIVVVLAAQLNRASEKESREPVLSDLRDSGDIEQDADRVLAIHRPEEQTHKTVEQLPSYTCKLLQLKGRNCGTAWGEKDFTRRLARFEDLDGEPAWQSRN